MNAIYFGQAVLLQIGAVYLVGKFSPPCVATGVIVFLIAFCMECMEFLQPLEIIRLVPFWTTTLGRGFLLIFLSAIVGIGHSFVGFLSFLGALFTMVWCILRGAYAAPPPFLGADEPSIPVEERTRIYHERKESYDSPRNIIIK
ncbi:hypothetical protein EON65_09190 [archaeon]|nr:MAG: hypothetical protein EON65_09190 [archaeon]